MQYGTVSGLKRRAIDPIGIFKLTRGAAHASPNPAVTSSSRRWDDLPAFATLTNDEERERKAETQRPGTFSVVATPESFSGLPEYSAAASSQAAPSPSGRRPSVQSGHGSTGSPVSSSGRSQPTRADPNTVVLDKFEDPSPPLPAQYSVLPTSRRPSIPDALQQLSISASPAITSRPSFTSPLPRAAGADDPLISHFRQNISRRLIQPVLEGQAAQDLVPGSTRDVFEIEAARFPPVRSWSK